MSPADRQSFGGGACLPEEIKAVADTSAETALQKNMVQLLDQRGIFFSRARMDKKTSVRVGMFDFTIYLPNGKYLAVEAKVSGGRLSYFQRKLFTEFWEKTGHVVHIIINLETFRQLLDEHTL